MSEFKGTPGPWNNKDVSICSQHEAGLQLGFLSTGDVSRRAEGLANAYLITAAPELLDALQETVKDLVAYQVNARHAAKVNSRWEGCAEAVQPSIDMAREAINKALGR